MSNCIQVYLKDSKLPTVAEWNTAIRAKGYAFDLIIAAFNLRQDFGHHRAMLNDCASGFEWQLNTVDSAAPSEKAKLLDCDRRADLFYSFHSDEDVTAIVAAAVLAEITGGYLVTAENGDEFLPASQALIMARETIVAWRRRGPFNSVENLTLRGQSLPVDSSSVIPKPRVWPYYLFCCGVFTLIWGGGACLIFVMYGGTTNLPPEFADSRIIGSIPMAILAVICALVALFYAFALFIPRKPIGWVIGFLAIIGMAIPFHRITWLLVLPLIIFWTKPETKRFFLKQNWIK